MKKSAVVFVIILAVVAIVGVALRVWRVALPQTPSPSPPGSSVPPGSAANTVPQTNIVASDHGGVVESITAEYGPGHTGNRLIDGRPDFAWKATDPVTFPQEIVFSFFNRQPALIASVKLSLPNNVRSAPKEVEVWTSLGSPTDGFKKVAAQTLKPTPREQIISFAPVEGRFLKLRVLSSLQARALEIGEVEVFEAQRQGYTSLSTRSPEMKDWKRSPRHAAQIGVEWLQMASIDWQTTNRCFGCHNQAQVIMGLSVAKKNNYVVSDKCLKDLVSFTQTQQHEAGTYHTGFYVTATQFASMGLAFFDDVTDARSATLIKSVNWLVSQQQASGEVPADHNEPPIDQGSLMTTANSVVAFMRAYRESGDARYKQAADRGLSWIALAIPESTQDKVFKVLALSWFGNSAQRQIVGQVVEQLRAEQKSDGGWQERNDLKGSNGFATGQVLYAFKQARFSIDSPEFVRGVQYLLSTQKETGAWPSVNSQSGRPSEFAPTMWAVIGLAGSFRETKTGGLQVVSSIEKSGKTSKNLEIILDASGSMNLPLGASTRIGTALQVLRDVLEKIPPDFQVGLRLYGHRFRSRSKQTCTDTELVLPIQQLDRAQLLSIVERVKPRGDTPLVYSVLQAPADLKQVGGGSVILITDGEDTCHGDPLAASRQLKEASVDVTLNIVGFTIKGKQVEDQLKTFAESTGGHYYTAEDSDSLARSLLIAASKYPYTILDSAARQVATGEADGPAADLLPGNYKVVVSAAGQEVAAEGVKVVPGKDTVLRLVLRGDKFQIER